MGVTGGCGNLLLLTQFLIMAADRYLFGEEKIEKYLLKNVLMELEDSHVSALSISRVLRHRVPDSWSKQDEEDVISQGSNESLGRLQEMIHGRRWLWFPFLECVRMMKYNLPTIEEHLPIKSCVLWFVPSPFFAAKLVQCCSKSKSFECNLDPFFWPSEQCDATGSSSDQFLYRYCAVFGNADTELVLVYPQDYSMESIQIAVNEALTKWTKKCSMIIYSTTSQGSNLFDSFLVNNSPRCSEDLLVTLQESVNPVWLNPLSYTSERKYFYQMIWFAKLILDIRQWKETGSKSQLLHDLHWDDSVDLSPCNKSILERNIPRYNTDLIPYMRRTRLWTKDTSSCCKLHPTDQLAKAISCVTPIPSPPTVAFRPLKLIPSSSNDIICQDIAWFNQAISKQGLTISCPVVICSSTNQLSPGLTTQGITDIAVENCCHLSIECILYYSKKI